MSRFVFFCCLITFPQIWSQTSPNPEIPDIFNVLNNSENKTVGYKIVWEISDFIGSNGTTYSVTEYYDIENRKGRLDIVRANGVNGTFIYIEKTNETFHLNEGTCTLGNVAQKPEFLKIFLDDFWSTHYPLDRTILGPSALLRLIKLLNNSRGPEAANLEFVRKLKSPKDYRYFNGNLWNYKFDSMSGMGWVFTDPSSPNPYGYQNMAIPIWVTVMKNRITYKRYEIARFTPYFNTSNDKINIQIPLGLGCGRNLSAVANAPKPPQLTNGFSYDMKLEVKMQPGWVIIRNQISPTNLVDNGRLTYDDTAKLMAWSYDGFSLSQKLSNNRYYSEEYDEYKIGGFYYEDVTIDTKNNDMTDDNLKGNRSLTVPTRTVWDMRANLVYVIDDINGGCIIRKKKINDFLVSISFKHGYKIPINSPELTQSNGYLYMGEFVERGIPVYVFEKRIDKMLIGIGNNNLVTRTVVFTHYFIKGIYNDSVVGNNLLLRIGISVLTPSRVNPSYTLVWSATINVNSFLIRLEALDDWSHTKQQVFNVKSCYLKKGLSKWFQLGFPITTKQYYKMRLQADSIDKQFLSYLYKNKDFLISPTRIPTSLIGWASNTLYITALMLERAPFLFDFHVKSMGQQRLKIAYQQNLVKSSQDCAGQCLDLTGTDCNYFSICDNFMCLLSNDPPTPDPPMVSSSNCTTYQKNIIDGYYMPTMNNIFDNIANRVQVSPKDMSISTFPPLKFTLYLQNSSGQLETFNLTAVQFKTGFNFGQINTLNDQIPLNNDRYTLKLLTHFNLLNNDKRFNLVKATSFLNCQQKCDDFNNDTCHSFSYCTRDQECIISTMHSLQIFNSSNNNTFGQRSDCVLLYRVYESEYTRFSSLAVTMPKTATKQLKTELGEECAVACSTEKSFRCRSYDICQDYEGPQLNNHCFLHVTHYLENVQKESIPLNLPNTTSCGHYSRNYASDFSVRSNMKYAFIDGKNRIRMTGLTVEQCAHQCIETQSKRKCLGFSFCQGRRLLNMNSKAQPVCVLSPTNDQNNTVYYTNDPQCEIYFNGALSFQLKAATNRVSSTRRPISLRTTISRNHIIQTEAPNKLSQSNSKGYSSSESAGVGIFMLLLGAFIGVISVIFYRKRKAQNSV